MLTIVPNPPINAYTWTIGALGMFVYVIKSLLSYRKTHNPLGLIYASIGVGLGLGFLCFGVMGFFSTDTTVLLKADQLGELFIQIGMIGEAWLLWYIALRGRIRFLYILIPTLIMNIAIVVTVFHYTQLVVVNNVMVSIDAPITSLLKTIIYIVIPWPTGYILIKQGLAQSTFIAKARLVSIGLAYFFVTIYAIISNWTTHGGDSPTGSVIALVFFSIFLIVTLWPRRPQPIALKPITAPLAQPQMSPKKFLS